MKLAILITSSILGLSSVAVAEPGPAIDFSARASLGLSFGGSWLGQPAVVVRDHRGPDVVRPAAPLPTPTYVPAPIRRPLAWMNLGTVSTGRQILRPPSRARFDSLVLDIDGVVDLKAVVVHFAQGRPQTVRLNRRYSQHMASPVIDLLGSDRAIERVVVYTADDRRGRITVFGHNDMRRPAPQFSRWTRLGALTTGQRVLDLDASGRFDRLALAARGRVHVERVLIRFANGGEQLVRLNLMLTAGTRAPIIDLTGQDRLIDKVIVFTAGDHRGALTLYAI